MVANGTVFPTPTFPVQAAANSNAPSTHREAERGGQGSKYTTTSGNF